MGASGKKTKQKNVGQKNKSVQALSLFFCPTFFYSVLRALLARSSSEFVIGAVYAFQRLV